MKNKIVKFSIENSIDNLIPKEEIEDSQFSKIRLKFYSSEVVNAHNFIVSDSVLMRDADTIKGKPTLVYYNKYGNRGNGDFAGHENGKIAQEIPCGFVPTDADISFERDDDGVLFCYVDAYIWKVYFEHIMKVFEEFDGEKGVSSEVFIIQSETLDNSVENVLQLSFSGITLLGETNIYNSPIRPAVDGCKANVIKFSTLCDEYDKAKTEFMHKLNNSANVESSKEGSFLMQKNESEEVTMEDKKQKETCQKIDNGKDYIDTTISVESQKTSYDDDGNYIGTSGEYHRSSETVVVKTTDKEDSKIDGVETNSTENKECNTDCNKELNEALKRCSELEQELNECKKELNECKKELSSTKKECSVLAKFKNDIDMQHIKNSIDIALNSVSHILNASQLKEWRDKSKDCSKDTVNGFINELKAFAFDLQDKDKGRKIETLRSSIPVHIENSKESSESEDVWERIERNY